MLFNVKYEKSDEMESDTYCPNCGSVLMSAYAPVEYYDIDGNRMKVIRHLGCYGCPAEVDIERIIDIQKNERSVKGD